MSAYSKVGLSPDCGASYLMPRIVGRARAAEFLLLGGGLDAETAHRWGVVNAISSADDIRSVAHQAAVRVARMPTGARAATKRLLAAAWLPGYREHLENERDSIARLAGTEESDRLRTAFLERGGPSPSETRGAERGSAA